MIAAKTVLLAFSMFSAIPVRTKNADWSEKNLRFILCAFPLVGVAIGAAIFIAETIFRRFLQELFFLRAAILTAIPVLFSGGIHLDGFCDTADAISSHQSREKMLEIMSDSRAGAFAVIFCALYFVLYFSAMAELENTVPFIFAFVMERQLSALSVAVFPLAKNTGLAKMFADSSARRAVIFSSTIGFFVLSAALIAIFGISGFLVILPCVIAFGAYYVFSAQVFGGITGDLAGAFVQTAELFCAIFSAAGGKIIQAHF